MSRGFFCTLVITSITSGTHIRLDAVRKVDLITVGLFDEECICANTSFGATDDAVALMP